MRGLVAVVVALLACASFASAETVYVVDFGRGEMPNEIHGNLAKGSWLTTEHAPPGKVALRVLPAGAGWVTSYILWNNWTWYSGVRFNLFNENADAVKVHFEIRTRNKLKAGVDLDAKPGENAFVVKFADMPSLTDKPFVPIDVGQWLFSFEKALDKPVFISEYKLIRENIELAPATPENVGTRWTAENAEVSGQLEETETSKTKWTVGRFPGDGTGRIWTDLRPGEKSFNTYAFPAIWLGYDRLTFTCDNPLKSPIEMKVLLEDHTARAARVTPFWEGQLVVIPVEVKTGKNSYEVLLKDLKTADGSRWFDASNVARVGFQLAGPKNIIQPRLRITDLRVRTVSESAGVLVPADGARTCARCGERLDDARANLCPFCGKLYNPERTPTPAVAPGSVKWLPAKDTCVNARDGGGGIDIIKDSGAGRSPTISVHHYDESFWEERAFLRFDPADVKADPAKIRKAELRILSALDEKNKGGKAYLCPVMVFVAPEGKDDFDESKTCWLNQPPIGDFLFMGGLYYYSTDWVCYDLTAFVKKRLAQKKGPFTLVLRAFQAGPVKANPHALGHHWPFYSRECPDEAKRVHLYVETDR
jgi:hypothetical protein